ncbi:hypothetical protein TNCV_1333311 [Trichonephila clavipes]|nr:hypothetical protein TNCV_1333311 [Trichonephila clavipes]
MKVAELSKDKNWAILNKDPSWVPGAPKKAAVAHLRLLTGYDCLRSHLYRIGIANSPDCTLWDSVQPMTVEHLVECPALISLNSTVEKYWRAHALMALVLLHCGVAGLSLSFCTQSCGFDPDPSRWIFKMQKIDSSHVV